VVESGRRREWAILVLVAGLALGSGCGAKRLPPAPEPDAARAFRHLEAQVQCGPRLPGSPGIECCRRYILDALRPYAARVATQAFAVADPYGTDSLQLVNLQANFFTDRPARVLLAAHYDSRPRSDQDTGAARDQPCPGANDGASGVAVLLEIARALATWDPGVGVDLVFFDGEDYGRESDLEYYCLGAKAFARSMGAYRPRALVLLDMVGDRDLRIPVEGNSARMAPGLVNAVFATAESLGVRQFVRTPGPAWYDDHYPFMQAGIPSLDLIDFDYPAWHTTRDLPDQCDPQSLAAVARVVLNALPRIGRGP
jgi:glutaminyl-peptide cyclotransferase